MIAIETRYLPPTDYRPSRIVATTCNGQRLVQSYGHENSTEAEHRSVAEALRDKAGWKGRMVGGTTKAGYCFVFVDGAA